MQMQTGIKACHHYAMRFEFQGRGTLHVHVVAWVDYFWDSRLLSENILVAVETQLEMLQKIRASTQDSHQDHAMLNNGKKNRKTRGHEKWQSRVGG